MLGAKVVNIEEKTLS